MEIVEFKDLKPIPDKFYNYSAAVRNDRMPIIIDNGSYNCRAGWLINPKPLLVFRNLLAKPRKERSKKDGADAAQTPPIQVGNDILNIEAMRFQLKTPFDKNVVTHFEAQEHLFDYTFSHLGINTEKQVPHPIVLTEPFLNPNSSRQLMSELLFECYGIPSLAYGVDSLYSYFYSSEKRKEDALIVNLGSHTMHVIPVLNNRAHFENTRRINNGGSHVIAFLHKILQLKYPGHVNAITLSRAEELLHNSCAVALNYEEELNKWTNSHYYQQNIMKVQLPYTMATASTVTAEQQKERKRELAKRLSEINARKREERLLEDEIKLQSLVEIQSSIYTEEDDDIIAKVLSKNHFKSIDDLRRSIANLHQKVERIKEKIEKSAHPAGEDAQEEPPTKQSKSNKMVFENEEARQTFLENIKKMRQDIMNRRTARKQRRQDMAKRRTAAGQERMRIISQLARKEKGYDDFGLRDEDWDVYKIISREALLGGDSDSDVENDKITELENIIKSYEPNESEHAVAPGEAHQLHIGVERYRAPELIFQPHMIGSIEAGLTEVIGYVLSLFPAAEQSRLAANVVLTGGLANLRGLRERVAMELVAMRPFQSRTHVQVLNNCSLSAWQGARKWANTTDAQYSFVTKAEYEERGGEFFKSFIASNVYTPTPAGQLIDICD